MTDPMTDPQTIASKLTVERYPAVFYARTDPPRIGVARYSATADSITIDMSLENKPGARWLQGEFTLDEAEQFALHVLLKVEQGRTHLEKEPKT